MSTKIQINSLEALERLIGGDTDVEIEIRNSIVQEFAKKHLKGVISEGLLAGAARRAKEEIEDEFTTNRESGNNSWVKPTIRMDVLNRFKQEMRAQAQSELISIIQEVVAENKNIRQIEEQVDIQSRWIAGQLTPEVLESRLNKMVDARLKERLGINW